MLKLLLVQVVLEALPHIRRDLRRDFLGCLLPDHRRRDRAGPHRPEHQRREDNRRQRVPLDHAVFPDFKFPSQ